MFTTDKESEILAYSYSYRGLQTSRQGGWGG